MRLLIEPPNAHRAGWLPGPTQRSGQTGLLLERQERSRWCWAAIAVSLARHFGLTGPAGTPWTQRELAARLLSEVPPDAAPAPADGDDLLNRELLLEQALRVVGCFSHWSRGRPSPQRLAAELQAGQPVCLRIAWHDGGSHYVAVAGLEPATGEVFVQDPLHGPSVHAYEGFPDRYRNRGGVWAETVWTRGPASRSAPAPGDPVDECGVVVIA